MYNSITAIKHADSKTNSIIEIIDDKVLSQIKTISQVAKYNPKPTKRKFSKTFSNSIKSLLNTKMSINAVKILILF